MLHWPCSDPDSLQPAFFPGSVRLLKQINLHRGLLFICKWGQFREWIEADIQKELEPNKFVEIVHISHVHTLETDQVELLLVVPSIHPSVFYSEVMRATVSEGMSRPAWPRSPPPIHPMGHKGVPRPVKRHRLFSDSSSRRVFLTSTGSLPGGILNYHLSWLLSISPCREAGGLN